MEPKSLKYWKIFAFILISMNVTLIVFLLLGRPPHMKNGEGPAKFISEKLKFTSQQEITFNKLKEAHRTAIEGLQTEGKILRKSFFDGLKSDSTNTKKEIILEKIAENQKQIELITFNHFHEVRELCSAEQKIIFDQILDDILNNLPHPMPPPPHFKK